MGCTKTGLCFVHICMNMHWRWLCRFSFIMFYKGRSVYDWAGGTVEACLMSSDKEVFVLLSSSTQNESLLEKWVATVTLWQWAEEHMSVGLKTIKIAGNCAQAWWSGWPPVCWNIYSKVQRYISLYLHKSSVCIQIVFWSPSRISPYGSGVKSLDDLFPWKQVFCQLSPEYLRQMFRVPSGPVNYSLRQILNVKLFAIELFSCLKVI